MTDLFVVGPGETTANSGSTFISPPLLMAVTHEYVTPQIHSPHLNEPLPSDSPATISRPSSLPSAS